MYIWVVTLQIKAEAINAFKAATQDNSANSIKEEGVMRFDLFQQGDDPTRFMLFEVYRSPEDLAKHKETAHYFRWREAVADMMAGPRQGTAYLNVYPGDDTWTR